MENSDTQTLPPRQIELPAGVVIPTSIVCPTCKAETGLTKEAILNFPIETDILCPNCNNVLYSCRPEIASKTYIYTRNYMDDDYD